MFSFKATFLDKTTHSHIIWWRLSICGARQNCLMAINFLVSLLKKNWNNVSRLSRKGLKNCIWLVNYVNWCPIAPLLLAFCHLGHKMSVLQGQAIAHQEHDGKALYHLWLRVGKHCAHWTCLGSKKKRAAVLCVAIVWAKWWTLSKS